MISHKDYVSPFDQFNSDSSTSMQPCTSRLNLKTVQLLDLNPLAETKIVVLGIPDIYPRIDPELIRILKGKLSTHLNIKL